MTTATVIAARVAVLAAIGDVQFAAAVPAAEQASQQRLAAPNRTAAHEAPAVGVVADQPLVPLERCPANVTFMVVSDQNLPSTAILAVSAHDPFSPGLDGNPAAGSSERVGAGIDRVREHVVQGVVDR